VMNGSGQAAGACDTDGARDADRLQSKAAHVAAGGKQWKWGEQQVRR
jgi:hypothetical protein